MNKSHDAVTRRGIEFLEARREMNLIDVGCGGGKILGDLAHMFSVGRVTVVDHPWVWSHFHLINERSYDDNRVSVVDSLISSSVTARSTRPPPSRRTSSQIRPTISGRSSGLEGGSSLPRRSITLQISRIGTGSGADGVREEEPIRRHWSEADSAIIVTELAQLRKCF